MSLGSSLAVFASASMRGPWSVPVLANRYRTTPNALICSKKASAPLLTRTVLFFSAMDGSFLKLAGPDPSLHILKVCHSQMLLSRIQPLDRLGKPAQLCQELDNFSTYKFV